MNTYQWYMMGLVSKNDFVSTWDTTKTSAASSTSTQVKLPLVNTGTYNFVVNWGDGNSNAITVWNQAETTHTYSSSGTYTITVSGICTGWSFGNLGDMLKFSSVTSWGVLKLGNISNNFQGCANLNLSTVSDVLDLSGKTSLQYLFTGCTALTSVNNINSWVTNFITSIQGMFQDCSNFNQALSFNTSLVTNMQDVFLNCTNFNQAVSFNTSSANTMYRMLSGCTNFNQAVSFDTSLVTNMYRMFYGCAKFNQAVSFNVSLVTDFTNMFAFASIFNHSSISNWTLKTTGTVNLNGMFYGAFAFNQPLNWNTIAVTDVAYMFAYATAYNQNLGSLNVSNVTTFVSFMEGKTAATFSTTNLDAIYNGWSLRSVLANKTITFGSAKYTAASSAGRAILTGAPNNWTITDGGI